MSSEKELKHLASALLKLETVQRQEAFDPINPASKPTAAQQEVIEEFGKVKQQWIRAGNQSGKSQTCARLIAWAVTNTHPTWKRPESWGKEPLLIIVAGRTGKQIEDSLLPKIRSYLEPGTYKEVRQGNQINRLELDNGDRIIFQSLENANQARERLQSYVAHITWCDELPPTLALVRELLVRTQARNGYNLFSFTPTTVSVDIQKYADNLKLPDARVYRFNMLDNPLYSDPERKAQLIAKYAYLTEEERNMVFSGDWLSGDDQVYYFNYERMVEAPEGYMPTWRHVEASDPAISSALGITVFAENPVTGVWYCILDEYIKGILIPTKIVEACLHLTHKFNIMRRTSDYAPWFTNTAASMGVKPAYIPVRDKNNGRKPELIKNLQEALAKGEVKIAPWCEKLVAEIQNCRWADKGEGKMKNSSSYHLLDSAQYFVDLKPKRQEGIVYTSQQDYIYQQHEKRKLQVAKAQMQLQKLNQRKHSRWSGRR